MLWWLFIAFLKPLFLLHCFSIPRLATAFGKLLMHVREVSLLVQLMDAQRSMERDCSIRHLSQGEYVFELPWWIRDRHLDMQTDQKPKWSWPGWALLAYRSDLPSFASALGLLVVKTRVKIEIVSLSLSLSLSASSTCVQKLFSSFPSVWVQQWSFFKPFRHSTIDLHMQSHCLSAWGSQGLRSCLRLWNGRNHWKRSERDVGGGRTELAKVIDFQQGQLFWFWGFMRSLRGGCPRTRTSSTMLPPTTRTCPCLKSPRQEGRPAHTCQWSWQPNMLCSWWMSYGLLLVLRHSAASCHIDKSALYIFAKLISWIFWLCCRELMKALSKDCTSFLMQSQPTTRHSGAVS